MSVKICLAALLCVLAGVAFADEFKHSGVADLSSDFAETTADGKLYFVKLYAPWCGHCKRLAPTWGDLADEFKADEDVVIAHVDCTDAQETCSKLEVRGYPTLQLHHNGAMVEAYRGGRSLGDLKDYVLAQKAKLLGETVA